MAERHRAALRRPASSETCRLSRSAPASPNRLNIWSRPSTGSVQCPNQSARFAGRHSSLSVRHGGTRLAAIASPPVLNSALCRCRSGGSESQCGVRRHLTSNRSGLPSLFEEPADVPTFKLCPIRRVNGVLRYPAISIRHARRVACLPRPRE